jgi:hypothetical protein
MLVGSEERLCKCQDISNLSQGIAGALLNDGIKVRFHKKLLTGTKNRKQSGMRQARLLEVSSSKGEIKRSPGTGQEQP